MTDLRTVEQVRAWARALESSQPSFAAELSAIAARSEQ
jgi:hypothetical protein